MLENNSTKLSIEDAHYLAATLTGKEQLDQEGVTLISGQDPEGAEVLVVIPIMGEAIVITPIAIQRE